MNTKNTKYGHVTKVNQKKSIKYTSHFYNPITRNTLYLGIYDNENDAKKELNKANFEFFSNNTNILPRCIAVQRRDKRFVFTIPCKNKTLHGFQSDDLDEVVRFKKEFISNMYD